MALVRIHQESLSGAVHGEGKMIGDGLMHIQSHRPAECRGKIGAFFPVKQVRQGL